MNRDTLISVFLDINTHLNLSSIRDPEGVRTKHIMDSLELQKVFPLRDGAEVADIWTWWGFPFLPLAMTYPKVHFTGIDARQKKVQAVQEMIQALKLKNAKALRSRSEELQQTFDVVTARAVGYVDKLLTRTYHLVKPGGYFIFYKQVNEEERATLQSLIRKYHLRMVKEHEYVLFEGDIQRVIYVLKKL